MRRWRRHRNDKVQSVPSALPLDDDVLSNLPDEQLIAWPDREAAFSILYSRYASGILVYCRLRVSDARDAEDLAASIFTNAWSAFPPDNRGTFRSWLFTIAHHALGNHYRHQGARGPTRSLIERDANTFRDPGQTPEMAAISNDDARELRDALAQLGDDQRQAIELRLAGLKGREIAEVLGRSEAAVKMLQYRAMQHLREVLSRNTSPDLEPAALERNLPMRTDAAASAEWLNDFWDRLVDDPSPGARPMQSDMADPQLEALVLYLESLKPRVHQSQVRDLRDRLNHVVTKETAMMTSVSTRPAHPTAEVQPNATPVHLLMSPVGKVMDRFAAVALILLIIVVAALVILASMRGVMDVDPARQLAAIVGLDEDELVEQTPGSHSIMSIRVRPGDYEDGRAVVGLWRVTLPGGAAVSTGSTNTDIGIAVTQGAVLLGGRGMEMPFGEGGSVGDLSEMDYVRNPGASFAELMILIPMEDRAEFPLSIGPWSADGSDAPTAGAQLPGDSVLLGSVEVDDVEAFQYRVVVTDNWLVPGTGLDDLERYGESDAVLEGIIVREGRLDVVSRGGDSTPEAPAELTVGDTLYQNEAGAWDVDVRVTDPNGARVLGLITMPTSENHTLDQSLPSIAPFWGEWTVPASGEINLTIRRLVIEPTGSYSLPTDVGVIYHVASGTVSVHNSDRGDTGIVSPGGTIAQTPGTILSFTNNGSVPVEIYQSIVSDPSRGATYPRETLDRVAVETLVETTETLLPGNVSMMMDVLEFNGKNDGGASGDGPSLVLVTSMDGDITVRRDGSDAELVTSIGEPPVVPALGESNQIGPGGYLIAQPGAGWAVTGNTGTPATGLVFSVSPNVVPWTNPTASPVSTPVDTDEIVGQAEACDVEPLTVEQVDSLTATPSAMTSPMDRSLRYDERGVFDPATTTEIMALLKAYTDCNATGDYPRIYAFYSDQAIRESEVIQELVASEHYVGEMPHVTTTVEDIVLFADGRAGARVVIDSQAAYLTFVFEDGRWKIDVWDDSGS